MVAYIPKACQMHTASDHHQLRAMVAGPSAPMGISLFARRSDRRQCAQLPAFLRKWRDTSLRRCGLARFVSSSCGQGQHRTSGRSAQDLEVTLPNLGRQWSTRLTSLTDLLAPPAPKRSASQTQNSCKRPTGLKSRSTRANPLPAYPSGSGRTTLKLSLTRTTTSALRRSRRASLSRMTNAFRRTIRRDTSSSLGVLTISWRIWRRARRLTLGLESGFESLLCLSESRVSLSCAT